MAKWRSIFMPTKAIRGAIVAGFAAAALFLATSLAQAAQGFIVSGTALKAGPDPQFPTVIEMQAGAEVNVYGCFEGHTWCDISFHEDRGWVPGEDLEVIFQSKRVKIVEVTTVVVPVVTFEFTTYWQAHYNSKPFFKERERFASININVEGGGKAKSGAADTGVTGSIKEETGGKPATEGKAATGAKAGAQAKAKEKTGGASAEGGATGEAAVQCPAGQKDCKPQQGKAGGNANAMGKVDTQDAMSGKAAQKSGKGAGPVATGKECKPGTADCPKTGSGGGG
jgi:uncharacterized protein YraI